MSRNLSLVLFVSFLLVASEAGAQSQLQDSPFDRGSLHAEMASAVYFEAWDYNLHQEWVAGGTVTGGYFFANRWSARLEAMVVGVDQDRLRDATVSGIPPLVRWHPGVWEAWSWFLEAGAGASWATHAVPRRGTAFNYLLHGGGGATLRLTRSWHGVLGLRWFHISNNGLHGRSRNPDIQALGGYIGVMVTK